MKKTLLAAALVIGFAGAAQAETSVTLYGIVDAGIGYQQVKGSLNGVSYKESRTGLVSGVQSGSRWGLKGTEDLGEGLQAIFQLESGFDATTGSQLQSSSATDRLFGRQATIGLQGNSWGRLDFGRQTNIASKYFGSIDPFAAAFGQSELGATFSSVNTMRWDNMVMYQTPSFSGFQFGAGYSFNVDGSQTFKVSGVDNTNSRGITTGLHYTNGPINVALAWDQIKTGTPATVVPGNSDVNVNSWLLGGTYDFEIVKVALAYGQTRNGWMQGQGYGGTISNNVVGQPSFDTNQRTFYGAEGLRVNSYMVGLTAPLGNGQIMADWAMADPRNQADGAGNFYNRDLSKQQTFSLGYTYNLSKRTNLYAVGSYAKHAAFYDDLKSTYVAAGIRHQF
jgi:predicted porin